MNRPSHFRAPAHLTFAFLACWTSALPAQTGSVPASPPTRLAPVVVQGRDTDLVGSATSASQGIVGAAQLESRPFLRRGELLEVIPGVVITQHSGNGKANQYFLRGFNLDHGTDFSLSVDGLPVNLRSHAHGQGYADVNFLIPEMIRQVDYNKGPFYAAVGDFSAAGAAEFRQIDHVTQPFVSIGIGENRYGRFVAGGTSQQDHGGLTGAIEVAHDDGPWDLPEDGKRLNLFARRYWATPSGEYRLTGMAYHGKWHSSDQVPLRAVESGELSAFGNLDPSDGGESERMSLSLDGMLKASNATTRFNAYAISYRLNLFSNFTYFLDDPIEGDQFNQRDRRWILGGALQRTWTHQTPAVTSETTAGLQVRTDFVGELGLHRTTNRVRRLTVRDDQVDEASAGLFLQNATRFNDWMRGEFGLRLDGYRFGVTSNEPLNSGTRLADIASPKAGLVFGPWVKTELYLNAGYGFHSNDARGTTARIDPADGVSPVDAVTPLVRSRGAELGVRSSMVPGLVSTVSFWALDLDSELVFVGDAGGTEPTGRTRRYGVEIANYYRLKPWLIVDADLALTHARYRDDEDSGTRIANSIGSVVTGGINIGGTEGWFGSVRVRYFGPQPLIEDNSVRAPSSLTYNASAGWKSRDWQAQVELLNVFDRENYDIAYFYPSRLRGEPAGGIEDIHFHPAEPPTVRFSVTRRF